MFGFSHQKKALFFRQLATMVGASLSLDRAVATAGTGILAQAPEMAKRIVNGDSMSACFARYPHLFSHYEVQLLKVGETSGTLDDQLKILATELEVSYRLRQSLTSKLVYPVLVAHMAVFVPPIVVLITKGPADYARVTLGMLLPIYVIFGTLWLLYRASSTLGGFRAFVDGLLAWVPVIGKVLKLLALTRFTRALAHLLNAGTAPYHAYQLAAVTCGNNWVSSRLLAAYKRLGDERKVSEWMHASNLFSVTCVSLVSSGEETGQFGKMLAKTSEMLEMEYQASVHLVMTLLPVFTLLSVGALVGVRVYSMVKDYVQLLNL
jgi:type IV pilus assembly protein PilC